MSGLALVAALTAQAATQTGAPPPPTTTSAPVETAGPVTHTGKSTYVELEAGAGYSTNPLLTLDNKGAGYGRISAHAVHTRVSTRTTTVLSAFAQGLFYTRRYGAQQSFDLSGRHDAAVSESLRLFVEGDAAYDKGGQLDRQILSIPNVPLLPGTVVPPVLLPAGSDFLTVTGRSYRLRANGGGQLLLSARDSVDFSTGIEHDVLKSGGSLDTRYTSVPVALGYSRQLNERTNVGARVVGQFTHYSGNLANGVANARVITPEITAQMRLSQTLTFSGDVGASFSSVDDGIRTRHSTGLAADANLCSVTDRSTFCGHASIHQQAATSAGPARVVSVGVDYSRRLTADDTLQFSLNGDRYSNPVILVTGQSFTRATYARAVVNYSRRIGDRLFGGVNLSARKVAQSGPDPDADVSASVFIRYRFGDVQ